MYTYLWIDCERGEISKSTETQVIEAYLCDVDNHIYHLCRISKLGRCEFYSSITKNWEEES